MKRLGNNTGFVLWLLVCGVLVLDIGQACVRAQDSSAKKIKTRQVQIVNSSGDTVATFEADSGDAGEILLDDPKGNDRLELGATADGGFVGTFDANRQQVDSLAGLDQPNLVFFNGKKKGISLGSDQNGGYELGLFDKDGNARAGISYGETKDVAFFGTFGKPGENSSVGASVSGGESNVVLLDKKVKPRGVIASTSSGATVIGVKNADGKPVWVQTDPPAAASGK